ncbi:hypothetical protein V1525DRAFT_387434 [Lipomyces kononenkoae]|uniref:Uncharacterized protein n=1 Tax=Lipomyces kononenkoae TaxID=34357 RepID=A0ACC3T3M0_LIPKO
MAYSVSQPRIHSSELEQQALADFDDYDYEELRAEIEKNDRIMEYLYCLPTPPCSPAHSRDEGRTATTAVGEVHGRGHHAKNSSRPAENFADALQPTFSQDLLPVLRRHHHQTGANGEVVAPPLNKPTIRHVPVRLLSIQCYDSPSPAAVRDQPRQSVHSRSTVTRQKAAGASSVPHSTTKRRSEKPPTMTPLFQTPVSGLNIMVLSPATSRSDQTEPELNSGKAAGHVLSGEEEIAPDAPEEMTCTIRQCSDTSSIYADSLDDNKLNGIPPDQSRFKQVWMRPLDDDDATVQKDKLVPGGSIQCIKRKVSATKSDQANGSATKTIRLMSPVTKWGGSRTQLNLTLHDAVSAMRLKKSTRACDNKKPSSTPSSPSNTASSSAKSGSDTGPNSARHDIYSKAHSKFESLLRVRARTPRDEHSHSSSSKGSSSLSLGIQDIRKLDNAEVAARHKEYLQDRKRDKRRSRMRNNWSHPVGGHENCTCCRLVDEFSRI